MRSINELPTASMGEATAPKAAINIPIVTAIPPDNKPTIAPRRREGEDKSEVCCRGASGSTSGLDGDEGVKLMLPKAKGVSAKSYDFDEIGNESTIDYAKMLQIVKDAGFSGIIGVEYEGERLSELEGIIATRELLFKVVQNLK